MNVDFVVTKYILGLQGCKKQKQKTPSLAGVYHGIRKQLTFLTSDLIDYCNGRIL